MIRIAGGAAAAASAAGAGGAAAAAATAGNSVRQFAELLSAQVAHTYGSIYTFRHMDINRQWHGNT